MKFHDKVIDERLKRVSAQDRKVKCNVVGWCKHTIARRKRMRGARYTVLCRRMGEAQMHGASARTKRVTAEAQRGRHSTYQHSARRSRSRSPQSTIADNSVIDLIKQD
ncbi:hypothetical protein J6590_047758 [Homalodisca vitripennis]|nr:hypothetical protein J6590_047758 [Homalodisca vitripennis]